MLSKQEREFLMGIKRRYSNPTMVRKHISAKSEELEQKIRDFVMDVRLLQNFMNQHGIKFTSPAGSDARKFLAWEALEVVPKDFLSEREKILEQRRKYKSTSGNARIVMIDDKGRAIWKWIKSSRKRMWLFAFYAGLFDELEKMGVTKKPTEWISGKEEWGMCKAMRGKKIIERKGYDLTSHGKLILHVYKNTLVRLLEKRRKSYRPDRQPNPPR